MKQLFSRISSLVLIVILIFLVAQRFPVIYENIKAEDKKFSDQNLININQQPISLFGRKTVVVFWATWCPPCKIELNRLNELMTDKKIPYGSVIAINMNESHSTVLSFLKKNPLKLEIVLDETGQLAEKYLVKATPTILFLNPDLTINWRTTGISPFLSFRTTSFLNN